MAMINLLPDDNKRDIRAARSNVLLLRYNIWTIIFFFVVVIICFVFFFLLRLNNASAKSTIAQNNALNSQFDSVKSEAATYRQNLATARKIFNNNVNYTSIIFAITNLLPKGVVLDGINLETTSLGKQTVFSAHAKNYADALQLKTNFQTSKLFSNVFLQKVENGDTPGSSKTTYPIAVTLSAKINKVDDNE